MSFSKEPSSPETPPKVEINTYADAMEALKHPLLEQALYDAGAAVMGDALITLHGAQHAQRRVVEFAVFRRGFFREYQSGVFARLLSEVLAPYIERGEADLVELGYRVTMNLTADLAGVDRTAGDVAETEALLHLVKTFSTGATLAHSTLDHVSVNAQVVSALDQFSEQFLDASIARRRQCLAQGEALPNDVLSKLLAASERLPLGPLVLRREIAFYLQAGAHSTANAMVNAVHEIFRWVEQGGCEFEQLQAQPRLVQQAVHESLRLHPASPVALRRATEDLSLGAHKVKAAGLVEVDLVAANRDRAVFGADAELFNPKRVVDRGVWPFGLSFGYGNHACMGRDLDGGIVPKPGADLTADALGIVPLLVLTLLQHGVVPDEARSAQADNTTSRPNFSSYPVQFTQGKSA